MAMHICKWQGVSQVDCFWWLVGGLRLAFGGWWLVIGLVIGW
jgi:hypothetical protein